MSYTRAVHFDRVLEAARDGEPWAFEDLFERVAARLHGFLRARGAADPEGLANEVLLRAFRRVDTFEGNEVQFRAWVFTIARNLLVDERRRARRRPATQPAGVEDLNEEAAPSAFEETWIRQAEDRVRSLLDGLAPDQRDVILLRVVADLSLEQTADVLGKSVGAVKSLQHRATAALRRRLEDLEAREP